jgi:hypothetical protein
VENPAFSQPVEMAGLHSEAARVRRKFVHRTIIEQISRPV